MRGILRQKEPALLAIFVWFGWTLFVLAVLMIIADLVLLYGDDIQAAVHDYFDGPLPPTLKAAVVPPPPPPPKPSGL